MHTSDNLGPSRMKEEVTNYERSFPFSQLRPTRFGPPDGPLLQSRFPLIRGLRDRETFVVSHLFSEPTVERGGLTGRDTPV